MTKKEPRERLTMREDPNLLNPTPNTSTAEAMSMGGRAMGPEALDMTTTVAELEAHAHQLALQTNPKMVT